MLFECRGEDQWPVAANLFGKAIIHPLKRYQRDAAVTMLLVVPGEEFIADRSAILDTTQSLPELRTVLYRSDYGSEYGLSLLTWGRLWVSGNPCPPAVEQRLWIAC